MKHAYLAQFGRNWQLLNNGNCTKVIKKLFLPRKKQFLQTFVIISS